LIVLCYKFAVLLFFVIVLLFFVIEQVFCDVPHWLFSSVICFQPFVVQICKLQLTLRGYNFSNWLTLKHCSLLLAITGQKISNSTRKNLSLCIIHVQFNAYKLLSQFCSNPADNCGSCRILVISLQISGSKIGCFPTCSLFCQSQLSRLRKISPQTL
jgi:hypothetical protein